MGFKRPSLQELVQRVDQDILGRLPETRADLDKRLGRVLAAVEAGAVHGLYGYLEWIEGQMFPQTCDDDMLHIHSAGVPRREASKASGKVVFTGEDGDIVPEDLALEADDGQEYITVETGEIQDGEAIVSVEAVEPGADGNQDAGASLSLVSPAAGIDSEAEVGEGGLDGGADRESIDGWRERILRRRERIPRGGAAGDWEDWALEVIGVTRAWEDPKGMGPGTVVVRIVADDAEDGPQPPAQLLEEVQTHIDEARNVLADVYVVAPDLIDFKPEIELSPDTPELRSMVEENVKDFVRREGRPGGKLKISRLRHAISAAGDVEDYDMQWPTEDVEYGTGELPVFEGVVWL
ncbi:baseplate J/gp47 family protein [Desulfonatronovibrio hydrogenovorans]|uniref:baseplate J/gp47 family protein n=1 Tax=Desulfonatronovibrio hydrogenovorans TaxID=53245 RepID=UPI00048F122D|nr:baseplate J/gp47 family protein [Desulfonatronovibrio hydrogenovorans]